MDTAYNTAISTNETAAPAYGMKWHKFLVNFSLWLGAILNFVMGAACMFEGAPLYGIVLICAAAYSIYVRFQLANFKKNAYKHLLAVQLIVVAADLFLMGAEISALVSNIVACSVNYLYYKKRDELFVN